MKSHPALRFLLLIIASSTFAAPEDQGNKDENIRLLKSYLSKYYSPEGEAVATIHMDDDVAITEKLKQMQKFHGLQVTGKPDDETLAVMKRPRCGVPDVEQFTLNPGNPKWDRNNITYRIVSYTSDMHPTYVDKSIETAFKLWSKAAPLKFKRVYNEVGDIELSFHHGDHHDNSPFDGPGGQLAHAFQPGPRVGGDVHFDEDEHWTVQGIQGNNLFIVAAHEIGHSLGLSHSDDQGALMYPSYTYSDPRTFQLNQDDINGIQTLYGKPDIPISGAVTPKACSPSTTFDAVTGLRGEMLFFKDRYFWRKRSQANVEIEFISTFWPSLPSGIQAAYENYETDNFVVFKGNKYWAVNGYDVVSGYPKSIYQLGFPRNVKKIDAAFSDGESGKTYFFVNDKYWRYDEIRQSMERGYPRRIAQDFKGVGKKIDAAIQESGYIYFFHGTQVTQFDPQRKSVVQPIQKSNSWLNC